jgi:hypothetical protein
MNNIKKFNEFINESLNEKAEAKVGDHVFVDGMFLPKDIKWEISKITDVKSGMFKGDTKYDLVSVLNPDVTSIIYGGEQLKPWTKSDDGMKPKGKGNYIK